MKLEDIHNHDPKTLIYSVSNCRESITGIGVVWPVKKVYGSCGCGAVEMSNLVAFFVDREDAEEFAKQKNGF